ncbi:Fic family protein [Rhizohabitans arisaemae]|uniref:Fic family protein n=1 Tax=Rhizohabitans arisaemae TaxID=2720610 RepID=UPI0024B17C64|nr:Fic family protein [Rhizohabitans arisaemae]
MVKDLSWCEVDPMPPVNGDVGSILASVDALRGAWEDWLKGTSQEEFLAARQRSLRRHAIETGIIERLYDVDWGVTVALVAEGLTLDAASRDGGISDNTLEIIRSQYNALEFLAAEARGKRDLSLHFIRQLHEAITSHQATYEARDQFGRAFHAKLNHGAWKQQANHVDRADGSRLEYTPPEHVQSQMESLLEFHGETEDAHPVVRAAWIHHRFIRIHPFEDGNGRVARALTLLVLLRAGYAPLVVDRSQRASYIEALDAANDGDLGPLIRLFARLEIVALRSELEQPVLTTPAITGAVGVAKAYAARLNDLRRRQDADRIRTLVSLADSVHERVIDYLGGLGEGIRTAFAAVDPTARATTDHASPPSDRAGYWRNQLIYTANRVDFYTNLTSGSWWVRLNIRVLDHTLRYLAAVQKSGHGETGVLVLTTYAEVLIRPVADEEEPTSPTRCFEPTPHDSVTLVFSDRVDERWPEIVEVIDRTLAASVDRFGRQLG